MSEEDKALYCIERCGCKSVVMTERHDFCLMPFVLCHIHEVLLPLFLLFFRSFFNSPFFSSSFL